jgi:hypothetical protein
MIQAAFLVVEKLELSAVAAQPQGHAHAHGGSTRV